MKLLYNGILIFALTRKPLVEGFCVTEDIGKQEIEQSPELMQVVLQRRTSDQKPISGVEHADDLSEGRLFVLDTMGLLKLESTVI